MAYVSETTLKESVGRLGESRASKGFVDFLIVKRGFRLEQSDRIAVGMRSESLQSATDELMAVHRPVESSGNPFINVFGTANHTDHGYRSPKYRSNGTSVTVPRWVDIFDVLDRNPAVVRLSDTYLEALGRRTLTSVDSPRPDLLDASIWFHRFVEIDAANSDAAPPASALVRNAFVNALGLTDAEIDLLFEDDPSPDPLDEASEERS